MAKSDLDKLAEKVKHWEGQAKKFAGLFSLLDRKYKALTIKFRELHRENQRLKSDVTRLQSELTRIKNRPVWSAEED